MVDWLKELRKYVETEKQKAMDPDFLKSADSYTAWDEVEVGREFPVETKFEVKAEDIISYSKAALDHNPIFNNEEAAKRSPYGGLIAHPCFVVPISFWCAQAGHGTWVRTPGARNPGQKLEWYEPFRPGDVISIKRKSYDKYVKRGKYYLTDQIDFIDQHGTLKARRWVTLILPKTREDVRKFMRGERGLEV